MKNFVRTPSGVLGLIAIVLLLALAVQSTAFYLAERARDRRQECITREQASPWLGLKESFSNPPGDEKARDEARKRITRAIDRLQNVDRYC